MTVRRAMESAASALARTAPPADPDRLMAGACREQVVAAYADAFPPDHPEALIARRSPTDSPFAVGRAVEAVAARGQVLAAQRRVYPPDHFETLTTPGGESSAFFVTFFLSVLAAPGCAITTRMAASIAARATAGLPRLVFAQIGPMQHGEFRRFLQVATEHGERPDIWAMNPRVGQALAESVNGDPARGFAIDRREARELPCYVAVATGRGVESARSPPVDGLPRAWAKAAKLGRRAGP